MAMLSFSNFEKAKINFNLYVILHMTRHWGPVVCKAG